MLEACPKAESRIVNDTCCLLCPNTGLCSVHLLGPKHFLKLATRCVNDGNPLQVADFWQTWTFQAGAIAFNHVDGSIRMIRRPSALEDASAVSCAPPLLVGNNFGVAAAAACPSVFIENPLAAAKGIPKEFNFGMALERYHFD